MKAPQVTKKELAAVLRRCIVNPKDEKLMLSADSTYYRFRALEEIEVNDNIERAIMYLAISVVKKEQAYGAICVAASQATREENRERNTSEVGTPGLVCDKDTR